MRHVQRERFEIIHWQHWLGQGVFRSLPLQAIADDDDLLWSSNGLKPL